MLREATTSITDFLLGLEALTLLALLGLATAPFPGRTYWLLTMALLGVGAMLGGLAHGLARPRLFTPMYLLLALLIATFVLAVLADALSQELPLWAWWLAGGLALLLLAAALSRAAVKLLVTTAAVGLALIGAIYLWLFFGRDLPGAGFLAAGFALSAAGGALMLKKVGLTAIWSFDHNGLYHLIQMVSLLLFYVGLIQRG
ncbi:MAG: hypothetical protein IH971_08525 [Candidatus Marinimicrobia bacterium]|nr:hypothetical protein [Candidatus Neomarinimicrobiota bacterium]